MTTTLCGMVNCGSAAGQTRKKPSAPTAKVLNYIEISSEISDYQLINF